MEMSGNVAMAIQMTMSYITYMMLGHFICLRNFLTSVDNSLMELFRTFANAANDYSQCICANKKDWNFYTKWTSCIALDWSSKCQLLSGYASRISKCTKDTKCSKWIWFHIRKWLWERIEMCTISYLAIGSFICYAKLGHGAHYCRTVKNCWTR